MAVEHAAGRGSNHHTVAGHHSRGSKHVGDLDKLAEDRDRATVDARPRGDERLVRRREHLDGGPCADRQQDEPDGPRDPQASTHHPTVRGVSSISALSCPHGAAGNAPGPGTAAAIGPALDDQIGSKNPPGRARILPRRRAPSQAVLGTTRRWSDLRRSPSSCSASSPRPPRIRGEDSGSSRQWPTHLDGFALRGL